MGKGRSRRSSSRSSSSSKRKRSDTVTITIEEMTAKMQEDIDGFKERHKNRHFKDGTSIKLVLPLLPEEWETNEVGKVLANFLNYDPKERNDAMGGIHSGKAMGDDDELENASVYLLQSVVTKELFEKSCFADRYPFPIPYNGKPEDILSDKDLKAIMDDWNDRYDPTDSLLGAGPGCR